MLLFPHSYYSYSILGSQEEGLSSISNIFFIKNSLHEQHLWLEGVGNVSNGLIKASSSTDYVMRMVNLTVILSLPVEEIGI